MKLARSRSVEGRRARLSLPVSLVALGTVASIAQAQPLKPATLTVRNHHAVPYRGPIELPVTLADGFYAGPPGTTAEVRGGIARLVVDLAAGADVRLTRVATLPRPRTDGYAVRADGGGLAMSWAGRALGTVDLGLAVRDGRTETLDEAVRDFSALPLTWRTAPGAAGAASVALRADTTIDGWSLGITATPYAGGWLDMKARLQRVAPATGPAYVALLRRVTTTEASAAPSSPRVRFNGRTFDGAASPDTWDRDFWYVHGVDWLTWQGSGASFAAVNGFTPVPTVQKKDSTFGEGSHFWVWERTRATGTALYLASEVAGPNAEQAKSGYMPVTPYAPMRQGDAVDLRWRLAVTTSPNTGAPNAVSDSAWAESQLLGFAGYRLATTTATTTAATATIDLGTPSVAFGTSYFPYSTYPENFDYLRTPGLDREVWWAFSPAMWAKWRDFTPRMRTDFRIVRSMGFSYVRLHHLELLQQMPRAEALAFLDFYFAETRALGLKVLVDTEGPEAWVREVIGRYKNDIARVEVENEVLLYGIKASDAARLASEARVAKAAAPKADVFLTSAGNNGVFERLQQLGVPFDRVGLHAYKHGPQWIETYGSHVLGTADYAATLGKPVTLGEFNWKSFGRISDEARAPLVRKLYETVLAPRAIPELFEFHFAETQSINTLLARDGTRHYEPLRVDRRPKPEAYEIMRIIRDYSPVDAPVRAMPVTIAEARFANGAATARYTITNHTPRAATVRLSAESFDGVTARVSGPASVTIAAGATASRAVTLTLPATAVPGTYHYFVRAAYAGGTSFGWGMAAHVGAPTFDAPVIADYVEYPQGPAIVRSLDWTRPLAVTYADSAPTLELESAHTLANTLQSATGRAVWLSSVSDLPDSLVRGGTLVVVGAAAGAPRLRLAPVPNGGPVAAAPTVLQTSATKSVTATATTRGVITVQRAPSGQQWLLVTGADRTAAQAAALDVVLRFWSHAKDAALPFTGSEPGAALGKRAGKVTTADLP